MKKEIWKPVLNYEGLYEISNLGRLKSLDRRAKKKDGSLGFKPEKIFKRTIIKNKNYRQYNLTKNKKANLHYAHRLVATAFIPNPENKPQVNHLDGIKDNNKVENLEWCTCSENIKHSHRLGLSSNKGKSLGKSNLSPHIVAEIKFLLRKGVSVRELSEKFNTSKSNIYSIKAGRVWSNIGSISFSDKELGLISLALKVFYSRLTSDFIVEEKHGTTEESSKIRNKCTDVNEIIKRIDEINK